MVTRFYHRIAHILSGLCLLGFVVLLAACSDAHVAAPPTPSATADHAITATAVPSPTMTATPGMKLLLYISCGGTKTNGYGIDVEHGKVCASTLPGAKLTISVTYCNGKPDPSSELQGQVLADKQGYYRWNWTPQPDCKGQPIWSYNAMVTASLNVQTVSENVAAMA